MHGHTSRLRGEHGGGDARLSYYLLFRGSFPRYPRFTLARVCVCVSTRKRKRNKDRGAPPNIIRHSCARDALWTLAPHPVSRDLAFEPLNIPVFSIGTVTILTRVSFLRGVPSHLLFMRVLFFHLSPFLGINSSSRDSRIPSSVIVWYFVSNRIFRTDKSISGRSRHIMSFSVK